MSTATTWRTCSGPPTPWPPRWAPCGGVRDLRVSMVPGSPEVQVSFDRDKLNRFGLSLGAVSETVQGKVRGTVASRFRDRERHVDIRVMNTDDQRNTLAAVRDLIVAERDGVPITLGTLADTRVVVGPAEIHRLASKRVAIVSADLAGRDLGSVSRDIRARAGGAAAAGGVTVAMGGQNDEMDSSFRSLRLAVLLAVFLVYLVMAAQFESFVYPLIIMFTVPLALTGAVYGLYLRGLPVSVIAVIGGIMLAGIVVNNGIVLVDRINQLRRARLDLAAAVERAGAERLRPILMTTADHGAGPGAHGPRPGGGRRAARAPGGDGDQRPAAGHPADPGGGAGDLHPAQRARGPGPAGGRGGAGARRAGPGRAAGGGRRKDPLR